MTTKYISIKAVVYDVSLTIDDRYWNEAIILEHATKAARMIKAIVALEDHVELLQVVDHKTILPSDFMYLTQMAYYNPGDCTDCEKELSYLSLPENADLDCGDYYRKLNWRAMRLTTNPYHKSICYNLDLFGCSDCTHEFSVSPNLAVTTTLKNGYVLVSYKRWPVDAEGYMMIPDDEVYKEAILYYVLYRYWLSKYMMKEDGAERRMQHFLSVYSTKAKQALRINNPDVPTMENLKSFHQRLVPRSNMYNELFLNLGSTENAKV